MAWQKAASVSEIPPESTREVIFGERTIALCNSGGELIALDGICPHQNGPLGQGNVEDGKVICPWHMWEFDCRSGEFDRNASVKLDRFPVRVEDGEVWIDVPEDHA